MNIILSLLTACVGTKEASKSLLYLARYMALLGKVLVAAAGEDGEGAREGDHQADSGRLPEACPCLMEAVQVRFGV